MYLHLGDSGFFRLQGIKVLWGLHFFEYLRTLSLRFQKARTIIEVVLSLACWLSQFSWDSQQGRLKTTSVLVQAFWNFKLKVLKYSRNCRLHNTLIPNLVKPLNCVYLNAECSRWVWIHGDIAQCLWGGYHSIRARLRNALWRLDFVDHDDDVLFAKFKKGNFF